MNKQLVEMVAARLYSGDWDMDDVRSINERDGFTFEHNQNGQNWQRTEGAHMSEAEMVKAAKLAADWQVNGLPTE